VKNTDIEFDYTATDTPDDVVRSVAAEISGSGGLKPLSDEERLEREIWREQQRRRDEERQAEHEYRRAEIDLAARQEAAAELAERNRIAREKARQEYLARQERQSRSNDLAALRLEAQQSAAWRNTVQNAVAYQNRQTLLNELEAALIPPPPESEPTVVVADDRLGSPNYFDDNYNPKYYHDKFWGKFGK
jgi:hypothetical protein